MVQSRTKRSTINIVVALISYFIQIVAGFIVRRYFIYYLGETYLGLSSLFTNILSVLSLAELGFGTAITFALYKPMAEQDTEKVKQLLGQFKKYYFVIGSIILVVGLLVLPFLDKLVGDVSSLNVNIYIAYLIYLLQSAVSYFFAHRKVLFLTSQRNDIETIINLICHLILYTAQLVSIIVLKSYYCYISVVICTNILNNIIVYSVTNRHYSQYVGKSENPLPDEEKKNITQNVFAMMFHKIGSVLVFSTDSILISLLLTDGLGILGKYSNYTIITTAITNIMYLLISAMKGSLGNAVVSKNIEESFALKKKLNFLYMWLTAFCTVCIFVLADPFIDVVLTKNAEKSLLLGKLTLALICTSFFLTHSRQISLAYIDVLGLFKPWKVKSLIEAAINLVVSVVLGLKMGLIGIIIGTIVSNITVPLWVEPHVLEKYYFKSGKSEKNHWLTFLLFAISTILVGTATYFICSFIPDESLLWLVVKFIVCAVVAFVLLVACLFWTPEFKECVKWGKDIFSNIFKKSKVSEGFAVVEENGLNNGDEDISNDESENIGE